MVQCQEGEPLVYYCGVKTLVEEVLKRCLYCQNTGRLGVNNAKVSRRQTASTVHAVLTLGVGSVWVYFKEHTPCVQLVFW